MLTGFIGKNDRDQKFIDEAYRQQRWNGLYIIVAFILVAWGIYTLVWHNQVFFHFDRMLAHGTSQEALQESLEHRGSSFDTRDQILIKQAYYKYFPDLFIGFGACALAWGATLLIYTWSTKRWLRIVDRLKNKKHDT